jgi:hypothetical protein
MIATHDAHDKDRDHQHLEFQLSISTVSVMALVNTNDIPSGGPGRVLSEMGIFR